MPKYANEPSQEHSEITWRDEAIARGATNASDHVLYRQMREMAESYRQAADARFLPNAEYMHARIAHVLENGRFFEASRKPKDIPFGRHKKCYSNSFRLALNNDALTYVDGFALTSLGDLNDEPLAIEHGWVVRRQRVIDVTWRDVGHSYFGVVYSLREIADNGYFPLMDNIALRKCGLPLLDH